MTIALAVLLGAVIYSAVLLVRPVHRCPSCRGARVTARRRGFMPCRRCRGTGRAYRLGAIAAHRLLREHAWPRLRDRIRAAIDARTGGMP